MRPDIDWLLERISATEEWMVDKATRVFARLARTRVHGIIEYDPIDRAPIKAYQYSEDSGFLGQATPVDTLLLNTTYFDRLSNRSQELVVQHELGHTDRSSVVRGIFWAVVLLGAGGIVLLLWAATLLLIGIAPGRLVDMAATGLAGTLLFFAVNRLEETWADLHALRVLGENEFLAGYDEIAEVTDHNPSKFSRIWKALCYTSPENVVKLNTALNRIRDYI